MKIKHNLFVNWVPEPNTKIKRDWPGPEFSGGAQVGSRIMARCHFHRVWPWHLKEKRDPKWLFAQIATNNYSQKIQHLKKFHWGLSSSFPLQCDGSKWVVRIQFPTIHTLFVVRVHVPNLCMQIIPPRDGRGPASSHHFLWVWSTFSNIIRWVGHTTTLSLFGGAGPITDSSKNCWHPPWLLN